MLTSRSSEASEPFIMAIAAGQTRFQSAWFLKNAGMSR